MQPQTQTQHGADSLTALNAGAFLGQLSGVIPIGKWTPWIMGAQFVLQAVIPGFKAWRSTLKK